MTPRTLIYGAIVLTSHRPLQLTANPVQRTAESLLAMIGHSLGYRTHHEPPRATTAPDCVRLQHSNQVTSRSQR